MVNMQMVPMKKGNVSLIVEKKQNRFGNERTFDSVMDRHYLFVRQ